MLPLDKRAKVLEYGWQVCHFILSTGIPFHSVAHYTEIGDEIGARGSN